jgi:hypothetical protein
MKTIVAPAQAGAAALLCAVRAPNIAAPAYAGATGISV